MVKVSTEDHPVARVVPIAYGRQKGRAPKSRKLALLTHALPAMMPPPGPILPNRLFGAQGGEGSDGVRRPLIVEIGFGRGERLESMARNHPDRNFIGVDIWRPGTLSLLGRLAPPDDLDPECLAKLATTLPNLRVVPTTGLELFRRLPDACVDRFDLIHPDPWPKRRHWKRRFLTDQTLREMLRVLRLGGTFLFTSDHADLVGWTLWRLRGVRELEWLARCRRDFMNPEWAEGWSSHYQERFQGNRPVFLAYRRQSSRHPR